MARFKEEKKDANSWIRWVLFWVILLGVGATAAGYMGLYTGTVVERVVFKESYQRSSAFEAKIAGYEAQLTEINLQLRDTTLSPSARKNLKTSAAGLRVQLNTAKRLQ